MPKKTYKISYKPKEDSDSVTLFLTFKHEVEKIEFEEFSEEDEEEFDSLKNSVPRDQPQDFVTESKIIADVESDLQSNNDIHNELKNKPLSKDEIKAKRDEIYRYVKLAAEKGVKLAPHIIKLLGGDP